MMEKIKKNKSTSLAEQIAEKITQKLLGTIVPITLGEATKEYLFFMKNNRAQKTYKGAETFVRHLLKYFSTERKLEAISGKDTENFLSHLRKKAPKAIDNYYRVCRAFFNLCIRWRYSRSNPCKEIDLPKRQVNPRSYIDENIFHKVLLRLEETGKIMIRNMVFLAFYSCMRFGEITLLRWLNIDLIEKLIYVGDTKLTTKSKKVRVIPMNQLLYDLFCKLREQEGRNYNKEAYIFRKSNGMPFTVDYVSKKFKEAVRALKIDESIHLHSIRHSGASHLVKKGANLYAIKEIMGHQSITTTQIYSHIGIEELRKAVNVL